MIAENARVAQDQELYQARYEALWGSLVDKVVVHGMDNIVFVLTGGLEIKA